MSGSARELMAMRRQASSQEMIEVAAEASVWRDLGAQTSPRFFRQLQLDGYASSELALIARASDLASRIFSGYYVESGKTLIAHVIGTASVLSSLRAPAAVVAAGLLHNAYGNGDFGLVRRGLCKAKRRRLRRAVGDEVELYLRSFSTLAWGPAAIAEVGASIDRLTSADRVAVLIRLAETLDHHRELAGFYYHRSVEACQRFVRTNGPLMVDIANGLGHPRLAAGLAEAFAETASVDDVPPPFRRSGRIRRGAITPRSYRRKSRIVLGRTLARAVGALRSKIRLRTRYRQLVSGSRPSASGASRMCSSSTPFGGERTDGIEIRSSPGRSLFPCPYAQTRVQLLRQIDREGYSLSDLDVVSAAYELAMLLFTGLFEPSRKTHIAHLVGTASILASLHAPTELLAAALVHSAYEHGDFGTGATGITDSHRSALRRALGPKVEEYVARYHGLAWNSAAVDALGNGIAALDPIDREVMLMRIASDLDELLDLGPLYCPRGTDGARRHQLMGQTTIPLAKALGATSVAAELRRALDDLSAAEIPAELRHRGDSSAVVLLAPQSDCRRLSLVLRQRF